MGSDAINNFISVHDIDTIFACMVGFPGSAISNMLSKISREPRELPWQPNLDKNKPTLHKIPCLDRKGKDLGPAKKISRESGELPWQPNLDKNKPKLHWFQFCAKKSMNLLHI